MDLNDLKAFVVVAREGNISRAAERLSFVQSNITNKIKKLENHFDTKLFHRHQKGVTLTSTGKQLLDYSESILQLFNQAEKAIKYSTVPSGVISLGSMETTAAIRLPKILAQYSANFPQVEILLETGPSELLLNKIKNYEIEGAFVAEGCLDAELEGELFVEEELRLVTSGKLAISNLERLNLLVFKKGCSYRKTLEEWLKFEGITPGRTMEFGSLEAILGCIKAGLGASLLPISVIERLDMFNTLNIVTIPEKYSKIKTLFVCRKNVVYSKALQEFINLMKEKNLE
ncbi:LysR family transcriptional regulator [Metallumcola ferriviriculae]|uniref:LysR family transcriptional regulator n=1 Tax=Metallumcola ferriviriculae TaxID=3039180 RepID=A0AAU0ULH0_9FIRM|nr:LysR family transcriptional regulator [Desulfitibacteraceae bacterium MK1]